MSKVQYAAIFAVIATVAISIICYMWPNVRNNSKNKHIILQLTMVAIMDVIYYSSFFTNNIWQLMVNHCLTQIFEIVIAYMYFDFVTQYSCDKKTSLRRILRWLVVLDVIMLAVNMIDCRFFKFVVSGNGREIYVNPIANIWYIIHLGITVWLIALFMLAIYRKMLVTSQKYRNKYLILNLLLIAGTIICAVVRSVGYFTNFPSVLLMSFGACALFYLYYYIPNHRYNEMKDFAIRNVTSPVLMFDDEDKLEFVNVPATKILGLDTGIMLDDFIRDSNLRYILSPDRRRTGKTKEFTLTIEFKNYSFLVHGQEIWDVQQNFAGTLLVYNDISKQEKLKNEATYHATRDSLTGLWNREFFMEIAQRTVSDHPDREFMMIVSDIDQFKIFNDILGTKMGDDLLLTIANSIKSYEKPLWVTARVGGDGFAVLMPREDFDEERVIERCNASIGERKYGIPVKFYLGAYDIIDDTVSLYDIYDRALMALESIKGDKEKVIAYYEESIREKKINELTNRK